MPELYSVCPRCKGRVRVPRRVYHTRLGGWVPNATCEGCQARFPWNSQTDTFRKQHTGEEIVPPVTVAQLNTEPPLDYRVSAFLE